MYELYELLCDVEQQRPSINSLPTHISPIFLYSKLYYRLLNHMMLSSIESMKYKLWGRSISMHLYFLRHGLRVLVAGHIDKIPFGMSSQRQSPYMYYLDFHNST